MSLEETLADIQFRLGILEGKSKGKSSDNLRLASEMTLKVLKKFRDDKGNLLQDEGFDDYREVCATIPILERALQQQPQPKGKKTR